MISTLFVESGPYLTSFTIAFIDALLFRFNDYLTGRSMPLLDRTVIRHYLTRAAIPALLDLYHLPLRPAPIHPKFAGHPEFAEVSGLQIAIDLWHQMAVKYIPELQGKAVRTFIRTGLEELAVGHALLEAHFPSAWSMKCQWEECLCAFAFSTYTRTQLQNPDEPWEAVGIRAPHKMKVCKGCWKVWYCGKRCQER